MRKNFRFAFWFLSLQIFPLLVSAYTPREGNVTATFGPYWYKTAFSGPETFPKSPQMTGFGLIALGDVNEKGALEIGIFHFRKIYFREDAGKYIAEQTELVQVTMGYRWWITRYFSPSLTFFSAYSMGEPSIYASEFAKGQEPTTSARDTTEFGFDFSIQYEMWAQDQWGLIADARYSKSVTSKPGEHGDHYGLIVALRYFVQAKTPEKVLDPQKQ